MEFEVRWLVNPRFLEKNVDSSQHKVVMRSAVENSFHQTQRDNMRFNKSFLLVLFEKLGLDVCCPLQTLLIIQQKEKLLTLNCTEPYMQYMEVPLTNTSQILDGFFTGTPDQPPADTTETELKQDFDVEKVVVLTICS